MGFADSLKQNILQMQNDVNDEVVNTFVKFANKVVDYSPTQVDAEYGATYGKGLFANSWYVAVNEFDETVGQIADENASGSKSRINSLKGAKVFLNGDGYISLSNNVKHAYRVEHLGWPSGRDAETGWVWTGTIGPYTPVRNAVVWVMGANKQ